MNYKAHCKLCATLGFASQIILCFFQQKFTSFDDLVNIENRYIQTIPLNLYCVLFDMSSMCKLVVWDGRCDILTLVFAISYNQV